MRIQYRLTPKKIRINESEEWINNIGKIYIKSIKIQWESTGSYA
jgi:hypothetical protein